MSKVDLQERVLALMPGNVYWMNASGVYLGCNDNQAKLLGFSDRAEIVGKRNVDIGGFLIPEVLDPINKKVMITGGIVVEEEPAVLPDGSEAVFLSTKVPVFNKANKVIGMVGISIDITDRKKAEEAIRTAKEKAEAVSQAKTEFVRNMSHDTKTPLGGVQALTSLLLDMVRVSLIPKHAMALNEQIQLLPESNQNEGIKRLSNDLLLEINNEYEILKESLSNMSEASDAILLYVNSILDFAKLENTAFPVKKEKVLVKQVAEMAINICRAEAHRKGISLAINLHDNIPVDIVTDGYRLQKILVNLVGNAVKFTDDGAVKLSVYQSLVDNNKCLVFKVVDTGLGIPENKKEQIFESFVRLKPTDSDHGKEGLGLGLSYVKRYVQDLNGSISVESELGKGSTFVVKFTI